MKAEVRGQRVDSPQLFGCSGRHFSPLLCEEGVPLLDACVRASSLFPPRSLRRSFSKQCHCRRQMFGFLPAECRMDVYVALRRNPVGAAGQRGGRRLNWLSTGCKQPPVWDTCGLLITRVLRRQSFRNFSTFNHRDDTIGSC